MNGKILIAVGLLSISLCQPEMVRAEDRAKDRQHDVASEVQAVFAAKCAACHGSNLAKPKGRFGYVL